MLLTVLLIFNILDFVTGMAANWGTLSSQRGYQGVVKKCMMWVWIVVANLVYMVLLDMGYSIGQVIPDGVALLFIINELISLGENSAKIGLDMPAPIKKALDIFNNHKDGDK
ncbi:holin [Butyricicoccus sp. 1XD8-22]|nr:holin [Butyricicoccus sp. 1XD8-22]